MRRKINALMTIGLSIALLFLTLPLTIMASQRGTRHHQLPSYDNPRDDSQQNDDQRNDNQSNDDQYNDDQRNNDQYNDDQRNNNQYNDDQYNSDQYNDDQRSDNQSNDDQRNDDNRARNQSNNDNNEQSSSNAAHVTVTKREIIISPDAILRLRMQSRLSSASASVGDRFQAVLVEDIKADNMSVLPAGCKVEGRVTSVTKGQKGNKPGTIAINFDRLILPSGRAIPITGELSNLDRRDNRSIDNEGRVNNNSATKRKVIFVGGGAAGGAVIGAIAGGGKGAGIGAAIGAGAGILGVLLSHGQEAVVESGQEFGLLLTQPLRIPNAGL